MMPAKSCTIWKEMCSPEWWEPSPFPCQVEEKIASHSWKNELTISNIWIITFVRSYLNIQIQWRYEFRTPGVDFSNFFRSAKFIEIALSIFAVRRRPTLSHEFEAKKFDNTAKGRKLLTRNRPLNPGNIRKIGFMHLCTLLQNRDHTRTGHKHANPWISEISCVGWGILSFKDFA